MIQSFVRLSNMYSSNTNSLYCNNQEAVSVIADEAFENIHIGMPMEQVISILGEAGVDIGSGTVIHKYTAASGTAYTISYICSIDDYYVNKIKIG